MAGPEGERFPGLFLCGDAMHLSRDWWAVIVAAALAALVKSGLLTGIPW